jgi:NNP family nitrate/nitrite transporter-like MFS transporter
MSTTADRQSTLNVSERLVAPSARPRNGHWIDHWDPDDPAFWEAQGRRIARRNLAFSMFADHVGFSIWVVWTIVVLNLADVGITLPVSQLFVLTLIPNLIGSMLRVPYTFAIPRFGGRAWTTMSGALLLLPALLLAFLVPSGWLASQAHSTQEWILIGCAATAGVGGGNFASSMANISFFYPERKKGWALGLNAAGGNLGVASAQLLVPLVVIIGIPTAAVRLAKHPVHLSYAGLVFLPFVILAAVGAWACMDSLTQAKADTSAYKAALRYSQTWVISLLYIGTFGSFIGFSFALPLVIKNTFPEFLAHHVFIATYLAGLGFIGALVGSLSRPVGGRLADRVGGSRVTLAVFAGMAIATLTAIVGVENRNFGLFFASYMAVFLFAGMGNGSTYKMIPSIFAALGKAEGSADGADARVVSVEYKRRAASVIGIAGAIGAFGGVLIQLAFHQASLGISGLEAAAKTPAAKVAVAAAHSNWSVPALWVFIGAYIMLAGLTWAVYIRRRSSLAGSDLVGVVAALGAS